MKRIENLGERVTARRFLCMHVCVSARTHARGIGRRKSLNLHREFSNENTESISRDVERRATRMNN